MSMFDKKILKEESLTKASARVDPMKGSKHGKKTGRVVPGINKADLSFGKKEK